MQSKLSLCIFIRSQAQAQHVAQVLGHDSYFLEFVNSKEDLFQHIKRRQHPVDCLILENTPEISQILEHLHHSMVLLPVVILEEGTQLNHQTSTEAITSLPDSFTSQPSPQTTELETLLSQLKASYHPAIFWVPQTQTHQIEQYLQQAVQHFLQLSADVLLPKQELETGVISPTSLTLQQRRLATKLKERLGYLGVYYKRNPEYFLRNMAPDERQKFLDNLSLEYREIILSYFSKDDTLNQKIDDYVNTAFFADIAVSQLVEIHMELMDEFSKQLQIEGRSEEILLDYRLTLIDVIAHLCEMYRRSIPKEAP